MARFRGTVQGNRGEASRLGHATTGLETTAATWNQQFTTHLYVDSAGNDCVRISVRDLRHGASRTIFEGPTYLALDKAAA